MKEEISLQKLLNLNTQKSLLFCGLLGLVSFLLNTGLIRNVMEFSLHNEFSTHVLLIPFLSAFLIFRKKSVIFRTDPEVNPAGLVLIAAGLLLANPWLVSADISSRMVGMVLVWTGGFLFFFGSEIFRKALFPLLLLFLTVPIPEVLLHIATVSLQRGSAETSSLLFKMTNTPFYRDGFQFTLPGINIEIATQCSSIRSSLALLISSLLASHLMLESFWGKTILILVAVPLAMIKNALRIVTLSLLAVHVDARWLTMSDLHRDGGILFFMLALLLMLPILWLLRKLERRKTAVSS